MSVVERQRLKWLFFPVFLVCMWNCSMGLWDWLWVVNFIWLFLRLSGKAVLATQTADIQANPRAGVSDGNSLILSNTVIKILKSDSPLLHMRKIGAQYVEVNGPLSQRVTNISSPEIQSLVLCTVPPFPLKYKARWSETHILLCWTTATIKRTEVILK